MAVKETVVSLAAVVLSTFLQPQVAKANVFDGDTAKNRTVKLVVKNDDDTTKEKTVKLFAKNEAPKPKEEVNNVKLKRQLSLSTGVSASSLQMMPFSADFSGTVGIFRNSVNINKPRTLKNTEMLLERKEHSGFHVNASASFNPFGQKTTTTTDPVLEIVGFNEQTQKYETVKVGEIVVEEKKEDILAILKGGLDYTFSYGRFDMAANAYMGQVLTRTGGTTEAGQSNSTSTEKQAIKGFGGSVMCNLVKTNNFDIAVGGFVDKNNFTNTTAGGSVKISLHKATANKFEVKQ